MRAMRRISLVIMGALLVSATLQADVSLVERVQAGKEKPEHGRRGSGVVGQATGSQTLTDASGFEYFINTDITFSTSSSASGAASEASYTGPVSATTSGGGTVSSTLNDAFDGYNSMCISTSGATGTCETGNADYTIYNDNGPATLDASCSNRQVILPVQTVGTLTLQRKVFVPANDEFARWVNIITNTGGSAATVSMIIGNNLGSDSNTTIVSSSDGDATAETSDTWVSTFQNYSGTTSSDPRLGHVLQGAGASTPLSFINFANGDDNPFWGYTMTLQPGETRIIMNFATGQPSKAEANAKAAEIAGLPANALQCLSTTELGQVSNFVTQRATVVEVPTLGEYGALALVFLLSSFAIVALRRRAARG
jgi:hypothetical protein